MSEYGPLPFSWSKVDQSPAPRAPGLRQLAAPLVSQDHKHTVTVKCVFVEE